MNWTKKAWTPLLVLAVVGLAMPHAAAAGESYDDQWLRHVQAAFASLRPLHIQSQALANQMSSTTPVAYGVVINGDTAERHTGNADEGAAIMQHYYHVNPQNIIFLSTHKGMSSTRVNVLAAADLLKAKVRDIDSVVVYMTGHGDKDQNGSGSYALLAQDTRIYDQEFAGRFLDNLAASYVFITDLCYSGGFAKAMTANGRKRVIAISSTDECHPTVCFFFIKPYWKALFDMSNDNDPKDGRVSEWEAFKTARAQSVQEHVRYDVPESANALYLTSGYATGKDNGSLVWNSPGNPGAPNLKTAIDRHLSSEAVE